MLLLLLLLGQLLALLEAPMARLRALLWPLGELLCKSRRGTDAVPTAPDFLGQ